MSRLGRSLWGYLLALTATAAAVFVRWLLDPVLLDGLPLVTLFAAVTFAVAAAGVLPAILATAAGYLACDYLFIEPRGTLGSRSAGDLVGMVAYLATCAVIIALGEAMRVARRRALERRELLRVTLASIRDAVITTDTEGRITYLNAVAEGLTGWAESDAAGQPLGTVFRIINEETRTPAESPVAKTLREGVIVGLANHTLLIRKDGTECPIDDSSAPIKDREGSILGVVMVFRDVAQRRRTEQELAEADARVRSVVDTIVDGIITIDEKGTVQSFNPAAAKLFGYPAEEVIGRNVKMLMPEPYHHEHDGYLDNYRRTGRAKIIGIGREVLGRRKGGATFPMDLAVSEFRLADHRYFTGIVRDITDRKRLERELRQRVEQLALSDRRKDEFLATLAHELRNPLAPIRNAVQILIAKGPPDPELQWGREVIDRQVNHMVRLLEDLLDASRISHNKLELRKERIGVATVIQNAVETSRPLIDEGGHELTVLLQSQPITVNADPVRLAQILSNLLNNAAKYTEPGGRIRLTAAREGSDLILSVKDNGMGIAPEVLPRIFEIFSQAEERVLERSQGGLGIGLSLVRGLVELHGGKISVQSDGPGKGSEFIVRLPIVVETTVPEVAPRAGTEEIAAVKRRIVIVDDLKDSADSLAVLLNLMGHEAHTANDGEAAIGVAEQLKPEVILLDIGMPKLNGYDACRRIRQQPWGRGIFLIAVTGWGQEDDRRRAQEAGFDEHMVKPVDPAALTRVLAELSTTKRSLGSSV